ncbi:hypothetical protein LX64_02550 [Chitinophaga skermanii]|uniref:Uncharacterized protein n=2 Tax=Chitinophaga skermanii TaxID=331697 RepID=A0A327QP12_9BACT|nr:hypothetical protein LX64_02550 [Chitinophaga skermanii]
MDNAVAKTNVAATNIVKVTDTTDHAHEDACSPFCICTCCTNSPTCLLYTKCMMQAVAPKEREHNYTAYYIGDITEIALPIWQPPQLAA